MAGKGSRQRTYGSAFESNYDRIFRKDKGDEMGTEWVTPEPAERRSKARHDFSKEVDQYPQEAREEAQKAAQARSEDV